MSLSLKTVMEMCDYIGFIKPQYRTYGIVMVYDLIY